MKLGSTSRSTNHRISVKNSHCLNGSTECYNTSCPAYKFYSNTIFPLSLASLLNEHLVFYIVIELSRSFSRVQCNHWGKRSLLALYFFVRQVLICSLGWLAVGSSLRDKSSLWFRTHAFRYLSTRGHVSSISRELGLNEQIHSLLTGTILMFMVSDCQQFQDLSINGVSM